MVKVSGVREQEGDAFGKTIIIVEDDLGNAEVLHLLLQEEPSYQSTCFRTAEETLVNRDLIKSFNPRLFILDYCLPSMTGLELWEQLHAIEGLENVPVLILSGSHIGEAEKERILQLGLLFISKPYDIDDLLATIEQVIA